MKSIFEYWKSFVGASLSKLKHEASSESIHQMAFKHGMDRRRHPRVNFPKAFQCFRLPRFQYKDQFFEIVDLSRGGVCLHDPYDCFELSVGSQGEMKWVSEGRSVNLSLQIVGASYQKKHLEFTEVDPSLVDEIQNFIESGIWGQKMHRSVLTPQAHLDTSILELWIGVSGASLSFFDDPHFVATVETPHFNVNFFKGSLPVYASNYKNQKKGQILSYSQRVKLLFFISNFPVISTRMANLLQDWRTCEEVLQEKTG